MYNIIPVIFKEQIHKKSLFHYTSITGFLLMMKDIREKKCYIFPGHMKYQNDKQELSEGIYFIETHNSQLANTSDLERLPNSIKELNNNIYIVCFSSDGDLLEQWKYYGNNCGLSIEFDFSQCEGFFDDKKIEQNARTVSEFTVIDKISEKFCEVKSEPFFDFEDKSDCINDEIFDTTRGGISLNAVDVLYTETEKIKIMQRVLDKDIDENMKKLNLNNTGINRERYIDCTVSTFVPICKNHNFEHERESRLLFFPYKDTKIMYREKNNRILPYLKCTVVNKDTDKYPISSVTIGPGNNQNLIFNSVINMLEGTDNINFFSEENFETENIKRTFTDLLELKKSIVRGEICCYKKNENENVMVYCSTTGILVFKSAIPFRD